MSDAAWARTRRPLAPRDAQAAADEPTAPASVAAPLPGPGGTPAAGGAPRPGAPLPGPAAPPRPGPGAQNGISAPTPVPGAGMSGAPEGGAALAALPVPAGLPAVVETGHAGVDTALARLAGAGEVPAEARAGVYGEVDELLRDTLAGLEERPGGPPTPSSRS